MSKLDSLNSIVTTFSAPIGRVLIAFMFFMSGLNKIGNYANTAGWMEAMGVPGGLLPLVIALEVVGGAAIILGWKTQIAAFLLAGFCLLSAIIFHADFTDQMQMGMFMKNVAIAGGFLFLVVNGAGNFSLDNRKRG
ncbi:MAG: DoxX family protein [Candidatus Puniceispirillum sp.]